MSLSARRAWIESYDVWADTAFNLVALRKESVDRKHLFASSGVDFSVALRKESVDRKRPAVGFRITRGGVALRKESVDRKSLGLSGIDSVS